MYRRISLHLKNLLHGLVLLTNLVGKLLLAWIIELYQNDILFRPLGEIWRLKDFFLQANTPAAPVASRKEKKHGLFRCKRLLNGNIHITVPHLFSLRLGLSGTDEKGEAQQEKYFFHNSKIGFKCQRKTLAVI